MTKRRWPVRATKFAGLLLGAAAIAALGFTALPLPSDTLRRTLDTSVRLVDRNGRLIRELRSTDGLSTPLPPGPIPPLVEQAFIAAEDQRFGRHLGIDPLAAARALRQWVQSGRIVSGASTIPQQLARQLHPRPRTAIGKLGEALWAARLTAHLDRDALLRAYLDRVPLGRSTRGVETAAEIYFNRPAASLSLAQAALIAGLARSPATADPFTRPEAARARIASVLERMVTLGMISRARAEEAKTAPLDLSAPKPRFLAPHFISRIASTLRSRGLAEAVRVETTLDLDLQADLERAVEETLRGLDTFNFNVGQAAVLVLDNPTGEVLAYIGSANFFDEERQGQNDGVRASRQPGSALKPFVYGLALTQGFTAASLFEDLESRFGTPAGVYVPRNYDRQLHGPVRLRAALANSLNIPAVLTAGKLSPAKILELLRRAGFESLDEPASHYGVGIALGDGDVTLWELARAYRGLARGGVVTPSVDIARALDAHGRELSLPSSEPSARFLPRNVTAIVTDIMSDERARVTSFGLDNALRLRFPTAVKTGTSHAHVDNWTVGYTRERTVAVWVGNFDGTPMKGVSGVTGAGPLFKRAMVLAMRGITPMPLVAEDWGARLDTVSICPLSGQRAAPACPGVIVEKFLPGTAPEETCAMHRMEGAGDSARLKLDLPPNLAAWAIARGLEVGEVVGAAGARLLTPRSGDVFHLDPGLPEADQAIPIRAVAPRGVTELTLRSDGGRAETLRSPFMSRIPAVAGVHEVELWVPGDQSPAATARFEVR